jgi:hypothetical protein
MSSSAIVMMVITWTIVVYVTARLFIKVLRTPSGDDDSSAE